jgi:hypothetical protein
MLVWSGKGPNVRLSVCTTINAGIARRRQISAARDMIVAPHHISVARSWIEKGSPMAQNDCLKPILDKSVEDKPLKNILQMSPAVLAGVSEADAKALDQAFGIRTVEDLATSKFFHWAQTIQTLARFEQ